MGSRNFFAELKRRNVYKVAVAYAVVGWLLVQVTTQVFPIFEIPNWALRLIVFAIVIGFPIALVIAWAFELTPEGLKRTEYVDLTDKPRTRSHAWIYVVVVGALLSVSLFMLGRYGFREKNPVSNEVSAKSIAVLPFENLSEEKGNAFFAEGVQDEILTRLAKVADLKVISRTSTQRFKSAPGNLREIAKQLGVVHILEGSVQKAADQVRVNVQLINALTDAHLWADTYDRKLTDIFAVESEIAKTIADALQAKLSGAEKDAMSKKPTANPEAYELYLQGRFFWNKRTGPDLRKSIDYFNQAIAKDPNYALAYAALAQAWLIVPAYGGGAPKECVPLAEAATKKALALDDTSSDAHAALGMLRSGYQFDFPGGRKAYERALQLNPNDATSHHWFATDVLAALGDSERAVAEMTRARELDPLSLVINTNLGVAFIHAHRLDDAISQLRKTVEMDGSFYFAHHALGMALEAKGQPAEAMAEYQKSVALTDDPTPLGLLGHLLGTLGRRDEASEVLEQLQARSEQRYVDPYNLAIVFLGLGDREQALNALEKSYDDRNGNALEYIRTDPMLDPLRGDPRFDALAEKIVPARDFKGAIDNK
jgi:TolB-like protein/Tfp pilus assembly protein PilF